MTTNDVPADARPTHTDARGATWSLRPDPQGGWEALGEVESDSLSTDDVYGAIDALRAEIAKARGEAP